MPYVMQWNRPEIGPELDQMAGAMGLPLGREVIPAITALFARIGIPPSLAALGLGLSLIHI